MRVVLLIALFAFLGLTSGCQTKTGQFFADVANNAFGDGDPIYEAKSKVWHEQREKEKQAREEKRRESDEKSAARLAKFKEDHAEYFSAVEEYQAWYKSLSDDRKAFIDRELEEKQIRYNQIHGFDWDGGSTYWSRGYGISDSVALMYKYKPVWDKIDH